MKELLKQKYPDIDLEKFDRKEVIVEYSFLEDLGNGQNNLIEATKKDARYFVLKLEDNLYYVGDLLFSKDGKSEKIISKNSSNEPICDHSNCILQDDSDPNHYYINLNIKFDNDYYIQIMTIEEVE